MAIRVSKSTKGDAQAWHFQHVDERGTSLATSVEQGGFPTLAALLAGVKENFPDEPVEGIGGDEPEADGLSW